MTAHPSGVTKTASTRKPARPKVGPPAGFVAPEGIPDRAVAVSLTLGLLKFFNQPSLADLTNAIKLYSEPNSDHAKMAAVRLSDEQVELLDANADLVGLVRIRPRGRSEVKPRTIGFCNECGAWMATSDRMPTNCTVTLGCPGKMFKPKAATKITVEEQPRPESVVAADSEAPVDEVEAVDPEPVGESAIVDDPEFTDGFDTDTTPVASTSTSTDDEPYVQQDELPMDFYDDHIDPSVLAEAWEED